MEHQDMDARYFITSTGTTGKLSQQLDNTGTATHFVLAVEDADDPWHLQMDRYYS